MSGYDADTIHGELHTKLFNWVEEEHCLSGKGIRPLLAVVIAKRLLKFAEEREHMESAHGGYYCSCCRRCK
jgi:hypothetical protein